MTNNPLGMDNFEASFERLVRMWMAAGNFAAVESLARDVLEHYARSNAQHSKVARALYLLAWSLQAAGKLSEAEPLLRQALELQRTHLPGGSREIAGTIILLGWVLLDSCKLEEAQGLLRAGLEIRRMTDAQPLIGSSESLLGECLTCLGRYDEAEPLLVGGYEAIRGAQSGRPEWISRAQQRVIRLYEAWGKPDQAERWRLKDSKNPESTETG